LPWWQRFGLGVLLLILLPWQAYASRVVDVRSIYYQAPLTLTGYFDVLKDPSQQFNLYDVQKKERESQWQESRSQDTSLNFGFTHSAYWLRLTLSNPSFESIQTQLQITYPRLSLVDFYQVGAEGVVSKIETGAVRQFSARPHPNRHFVFPIDVPATSVQTIYLRIQSATAVVVPAKLWTLSTLRLHETYDYAIQTWYFGIVTAMVVFNLLLFFALRDRMYFAYVLFAICMALTIASMNGLSKQFLWPDATWWADAASYTGLALSQVTFLFFMRIMLRTQSMIPRLDKLLLVSALMVLVVAATLMFSLERFAMIAAILLALNTVVVFSVGVYAAWQRQRMAYYFVLAYVVLTVGSVITALHANNLMPTSVWTVYSLQAGSVIEMLLLALALADRLNQARKEQAHAQTVALQAQNDMLLAKEQAVRAHSEVMLAQAREQTQQALHETLQAQHALAEAQLQQNDKMASLGQLIAGVTHEINTPIGAIKSSGASIADALSDALNQLPVLLQQLDSSSRALLLDMLQHVHRPKNLMSSREERAIVKAATEKIEAAGIEQPRQKAVVLTNLNAHHQVETYLPLLQHPLSEDILLTANNVAIAVSSARNINLAVERVTKIVLALKSFSRFNHTAEKTLAQLADGIETVLTIYQAQTKHGVEIVRNYEDIAPLLCLPDELIQVWTNLIHNALQAMNHAGTLTIGIRQDQNQAVVTIGDTGCGIPAENINKIFEVFFTTKAAGVGSGLGLDIVRKIIDKHQGRIEVQSEVGVGTVFSVYLPYVND
jgi:signal transduction histidine kinase